MGGRETAPLDDCRGGETGESGFAQDKDSNTLLGVAKEYTS